eukprot:CAMPEP_0113229660 /NCGR_PEP_ID=MMETSP0008_2-20120614/469_1 /TAXON_ID=97485 /ORGANISM="Prymnesium parvum" /LENGTH=72 /DNA_ID=CAMNT_0000076191 /DNA_START=304 /DNA_END=522 /DNA_ORIENTATION=+ /assembly_acc=CAM_ASM_000153
MLIKAIQRRPDGGDPRAARRQLMLDENAGDARPRRAHAASLVAAREQPERPPIREHDHRRQTGDEDAVGVEP